MTICFLMFDVHQICIMLVGNQKRRKIKRTHALKLKL